MDQLIQFLADTLGVPYGAVEGSVATLAFMLCAFLLKLLWDASKRDNKQVDLEQTLAQLAIRSLNSYDANTKTIEDNTEAIKKIGALLDGMKNSFSDLTGEIKNVVSGIKVLTEHSEATKPVLDEIKGNLLKTSKTIIVIKGPDGSVLYRLVAEPDENGELVVLLEKAE